MICCLIVFIGKNKFLFSPVVNPLHNAAALSRYRCVCHGCILDVNPTFDEEISMVIANTDHLWATGTEGMNSYDILGTKTGPMGGVPIL